MAEETPLMTPQQKIWEANFANCCLLLEQSCFSIANLAFQAGLIGWELVSAVSNKTLVVTRKQQAMSLITALLQKMKHDRTEADNVMKNFLQILEKDASFSNLRQQLEQLLQEEKSDNPEVSVFQKKIFAIASLIENSLGTVSSECLSRGIIGQETFSLMSSSSAGHTSHYIKKVMSVIGVKIQEDPDNLELFVEKVLAMMGGFTDTLIAQLRT